MPGLGLTTINDLENGLPPVNDVEETVCFSAHGFWNNMRIPVEATPDGHVTFRDIPVEVLRSSNGELEYYLNMLPFGGLSEDEELDPNIKRWRVELEEQRDMYRGENIDHLLPEELLDAESREDEDEEGNDAASDEGNKNDDYDAGTRAGAGQPAASVTAGPSANDAVFTAPKLADDFTYVGPPTGFPDSDYNPVPGAGWPRDLYEDAIGDARHAFEHVDLSEGKQSEPIYDDRDQEFLFPHDESELLPTRSFQITVKTQKGKLLAIFPHDRRIVVEQDGNMNTSHFTASNMMESCWLLLRNDRIAQLQVIGGHESINVHFGITWIRGHAGLYLHRHRPAVDVYQQIQDHSLGHRLYCHRTFTEFIYSKLDPMTAHSLLRLPLAPIMTSRFEQQADGIDLLLDDQNLTVSHLVKQIYLAHKWNIYQARSAWDENHGCNERFPEPRIQYKSEAAFVDDWVVAEDVTVPSEYQHNNPADAPFDLQQLSWFERTGISPETVRRSRDDMYQHYRAERDTEAVVSLRTPLFAHTDINQEYEPLAETTTGARFNPQAMHTKHRANTPHFQLRNHFAVQDHLRNVYSDGSHVWSEYSWSSQRVKVIDNNDIAMLDAFADQMSISTLALSTDHPRSICMIGGLRGEFACKSLLGDNDALKTNPIESGFVTKNTSGVINHIDIDYYSNRQNYHAVISCNDNKIRVFDLQTSVFLNSPGISPTRNGTSTGHSYDFAINCTATCPDGRLRVAIGDDREPLIINAQTGKIERKLTGHSDHAFACAWSPDAHFIATAAQDRLVNVYDTRTWRIVNTFSSHVSTHRSMKFSPVGGGTRCLLLAEEADRVTIVNAHTFDDAQTHSFYGSIVGADFERDGAGFWIANSDEKFGGFMRYQRTGQGQSYGLHSAKQAEIEEGGDEYEEVGPNEWIWDEDRVRDPRCVNPHRHGKTWNSARRFKFRFDLD